LEQWKVSLGIEGLSNHKKNDMFVDLS